MGIAFDAVCEKMEGLAYSDVVKEIIAKRIIEVASRTRAADPEWLVDQAIKSLAARPYLARLVPRWWEPRLLDPTGEAPRRESLAWVALAFPSAGFNRGRSFRCS
jgi:hypothetical protein